MLKIESGATTNTPILLIIVAAAAFALRCALVSQEIANPPRPTYQVAWNKPTGKKPETEKPILYVFTTAWSGACQELESNCFANKEVIARINDSFYPVRVDDQSLDERINPPEIQELEDKFSVSTFPEMVVTLPSTEFVGSRIGIVKIREIKNFLDEALKLVPYTQGRSWFGSGEYMRASESFDRFIAQNGWDNGKAGWSAVRRYFCLRFLKKEAEASAYLDVALDKLPHDRWPYAIFRYLKGSSTYEQLKKDAGDDRSNRISYRTYSGLESFCDGKFDQAKEDLGWVIDQDSFKDWVEYKVAMTVLKRMDKGTASGVNKPKPRSEAELEDFPD